MGKTGKQELSNGRFYMKLFVEKLLAPALLSIITAASTALVGWYVVGKSQVDDEVSRQVEERRRIERAVDQVLTARLTGHTHEVGSVRSSIAALATTSIAAIATTMSGHLVAEDDLFIDKVQTALGTKVATPTDGLLNRKRVRQLVESEMRSRGESKK